MKFQTKINLLQLKMYFDIGFGFLSYIKYFVAFYALSSMNVETTMWLVVVFGIFCFVFGWLFVKFRWYEAQIEVTNKFNLFVLEVRKKLIKKSNSKKK